MAARKIGFNSAAVMDEMTIAINGPVHFDDYISEMNSRIDNAVSDYDMSEYNAIVSEMRKFDIKPSIVLDAPIEIELPNHGWAHVPAKEMEESTIEEMESADPIDEFFTEFDKAHSIGDEMEKEIHSAVEEMFNADEFDCIAD